MTPHTCECVPGGSPARELENALTADEILSAAIVEALAKAGRNPVLSDGLVEVRYPDGRGLYLYPHAALTPPPAGVSRRHAEMIGCGRRVILVRGVIAAMRAVTALDRPVKARRRREVVAK